MYFPHPKKPKPFRCRGCGKWFVVPNGPRFVCAVAHQPGDCCHMGETQVAEPPFSGSPPDIGADVPGGGAV